MVDDQPGEDPELADFDEVLSKAYRVHASLTTETRAAQSAKPNLPCPCGSGTKGKKCCGNPVTASRKRRQLQDLRDALCSKY